MTKQKNNLILTILISITLILAVVGVWLIKGGNPIGSNTSTGIYTLDSTYNFNIDEVLSHNLPTIIDFGSSTCPYCIQMAGALSSANERYIGRAIIKYIDVEVNTTAASEFNITSIPTQVFFHANGTYMGDNTGPLTDANFDSILTDLGVI
jgi:thioredoxin 1